MLTLEFSDREMTAREIYLIEQCSQGSAILSAIEFIISRIAQCDDQAALVAVLYNSPVSEIRRYYNEAADLALAVTEKAIKAVDAEFAERRKLLPSADDEEFPGQLP